MGGGIGTYKHTNHKSAKARERQSTETLDVSHVIIIRHSAFFINRVNSRAGT
jgi:hypothetical protein